MKSARILSRRCSLKGIAMKNGSGNATTTTSSYRLGGGTSKVRCGSRSRHCSPIGSCAPSISSGQTVSQLFISSPSAITGTLSSLLEYDEEDIDGTWFSNLVDDTHIYAKQPMHIDDENEGEKIHQMNQFLPTLFIKIDVDDEVRIERSFTPVNIWTSFSLVMLELRWRFSFYLHFNLSRTHICWYITVDFLPRSFGMSKHVLTSTIKNKRSDFSLLFRKLIEFFFQTWTFDLALWVYSQPRVYETHCKGERNSSQI